MNTLTFVVIISSLVIIGILSFIDELHTIRKTQDEILKFHNVVCALYDKCNNEQNYDTEWTTLLSDYKNVYRLMSPHCYRPSTYDIVAAISNNNKRGLSIQVSVFNEEVVSTIAEYDIEYDKLLSQWWNVFSHFFRGIGSVLRIVFQYPIKLISPNFNFKSKGWNIFRAITGVIGSVVSILYQFLT